ncbi:MAG: CapA family protein, partial [Candidatus Adiutrix sp.]|nr:CapA family protein [Candidatus Adiutrix sp.]
MASPGRRLPGPRARRPFWPALGLALACILWAGAPTGVKAGSGAASAALGEPTGQGWRYPAVPPAAPPPRDRGGWLDWIFKGRTIRLAAVGDLMLGQVSPENRDIFAEVKPFLADRQVVFGNLEGPLTDRGSPTKDPSAGAYHLFRSPPACGRLLSEAGFNLLSLANNHINDYGPAGRAQTVSVLDSLGLHHAGGPGEVARLKINKTRLALIALAPNAGCQKLNDLEGAVALVKAEKAESGALVIVSLHGGGEGSAFMRR